VIRAILLAAGAGSRFGGDKLLAPLGDGRPLAVAAADNLRAGGVAVTAVVRPGDSPLTDTLTAAGATVVACPRAAEGMGASLAWGAAAAPPAPGFLVALGDMPWIRPATVAAVAAALERGSPLARPVHAGRAGHPVGFADGFRPDLAACRGDCGARHLLAAQSERVVEVAVNDPGIHRDVDHPADLVAAP